MKKNLYNELQEKSKQTEKDYKRMKELSEYRDFLEGMHNCRITIEKEDVDLPTLINKAYHDGLPHSNRNLPHEILTEFISLHKDLSARLIKLSKKPFTSSDFEYQLLQICNFAFKKPQIYGFDVDDLLSNIIINYQRGGIEEPILPLIDTERGFFGWLRIQDEARGKNANKKDLDIDHLMRRIGKFPKDISPEEVLKRTTFLKSYEKYCKRKRSKAKKQVLQRHIMDAINKTENPVTKSALTIRYPNYNEFGYDINIPMQELRDTLSEQDRIIIAKYCKQYLLEKLSPDSLECIYHPVIKDNYLIKDIPDISSAMMVVRGLHPEFSVASEHYLLREVDKFKKKLKERLDKNANMKETIEAWQGLLQFLKK